MRNQELSRKLQRIKSLFAQTREVTDGNLELQSHWARYLCVLCAGFLEDVMPQIYGEYAKKSSNPAISNYVFRQLDRIQNPKTQKIIDITTQLHKSWGTELAIFADENGRKEAIDAIMANRHNIAHGEPSGITIVSLDTYLARALEVVDFLESKTLGSQPATPSV